MILAQITLIDNVFVKEKKTKKSTQGKKTEGRGRKEKNEEHQLEDNGIFWTRNQKNKKKCFKNSK